MAIVKVQYFEKHYLMTTFIKFQIISVALTLHILHRVKIILNLSTGIVEAASAVPNSKAGLFIFVVFHKMFKGGITNVYLKGELLKNGYFTFRLTVRGGTGGFSPLGPDRSHHSIRQKMQTARTQIWHLYV